MHSTAGGSGPVRRDEPAGESEPDARLPSPATVSVADGRPYATTDQPYRQADYQRGPDLQCRPDTLSRVPIDAGAVRLVPSDGWASS